MLIDSGIFPQAISVRYIKHRKHILSLLIYCRELSACLWVCSVSLDLLTVVYCYEIYRLYETLYMSTQHLSTVHEICLVTCCYTLSLLLFFWSTVNTLICTGSTHLSAALQCVLCLLLEHLGAWNCVCFSLGEEEGTSDAEAWDCCCCIYVCTLCVIRVMSSNTELDFKERNLKIKNSELN